MPLSPRTKTLLALAALLALAGGHFAARQWRAAQQPAAAATPQACQPRQGCTLPNGSRIRFAAALREPFDIELANVPPEVQRVEVSFSMANMDMGFNRYPLARQPNGSWLAAQIRLPVCTDRRHDYLADVRIGEQVFQVAFEAQ